MQKKNAFHLLFGLLLWAASAGLPACTASPKYDSEQVLIRVGNHTVTVNEYLNRFELAVVAYPLQVLKDRQIVAHLQVRLLNQVIDELAILSRADELGLSVSDEALASAINRIKQDYPDDTFEKMLLEQSISFRDWQAGLKKRLLVEKVVQVDLLEEKGDALAASDPSAELDMMETASERSVSKGTQEALSGLLEKRKAYVTWISKLRLKYPISVNEGLWNKLQYE